MTKVSIIIPIYNAEEYLGECLDSVLNQTLKDIEVVCVNDGSIDKSLEIINEYKNKYKNKNIKIINQKNAGVIKARITGFKNATGKYIGWVDADDVVDKTMFEKLYKACIKNKAEVSYCNYNFFPKEVINKEKWFKKYEGNKTWQFVNKNTIQWNKIVSRDLLNDMNLEELFEKYGEGSYAFVLIKANGIVSVDECLYNYRVGHTSLSSNFKNVEWFKKTVDINKSKIQYIEEHLYDEYWLKYFTYLYLYYSLILMIVSAYNNNKKYYNLGKINIKEYKLFSKKYNEYLKYNFSKLKYIFLKYFGCKSYFMMKIAAKIVLK